MAEKDFTATENQDRGKTPETQERRTSSVQPLSKQEKNENKTDVKNAHATGDGSFGRSESSLPESGEEQEKPGDNPY